jgi:hypothetical protein
MSNDELREETAVPEQSGKIPLACNMLALGVEERPLHEATTAQLRKAIREIRELPDGYAFRFAASHPIIMMLCEFIARERLCCPCFTFELIAEQGEGPLWLSLRGQDGIKEFIAAELNVQP